MGYTCHSCGAWHDERPTCFRAELPAAVAALSDIEMRRRVERAPSQCILDGEHFFILGTLDIPIRGSSEEFLRWSVWSTLSKANFKRAWQLWEVTGRESEPPYFGSLSNQIPGYPASVDIKVQVQTQPVGIRPTLRVIEEGHPLAIEQLQGITEERADELIHAALDRGAEGDDR